MCVAKLLAPFLLVIPSGGALANPNSLSKGFDGDAVALLIFFMIKSSSRMVIHLP